MNNKNNKITAMIIDDSRLARIELVHLLKSHEKIEIIAQSGSPKQAIKLIAEKKPDVLFLDIQMPVINGFELLQQLDYVPEVVFVTAFDQYAIKAFQHNALDYLQKPIEPKDLSRAVNKLSIATRKNPTKENINILERVFVKDGDDYWFVKVEQIRYFEVDGNYTMIHFDEHHPMIPKTLNYLESRLDSRMFFRANRNQIINIKHIEKIEPWIQGFRVILSHGESIELSRRQTKKFKELMSF